jgi:hypothetical protein
MNVKITFKGEKSKQEIYKLTVTGLGQLATIAAKLATTEELRSLELQVKEIEAIIYNEQVRRKDYTLASGDEDKTIRDYSKGER